MWELQLLQDPHEPWRCPPFEHSGQETACSSASPAAVMSMGLLKYETGPGPCTNVVYTEVLKGRIFHYLPAEVYTHLKAT